MNEAKTSLYGRIIAKKIVSYLLVLAMILGLAPTDFAFVAKAAEGMNVTLHFQPTADWERPAIQVWDGSPVVTGAGEAEEIEGWGGAMGTPMTAEEDGWYAVTVKGNIGGFQFLDLSNPNGNNINGIYKSTMKNYTDAQASDLYYMDGTWYLDQDGKEAMPLPTPVKVTIHFLNSKGWEAPTVNAWNNVKVTGSAGKAETTTWAKGMPLFTLEDGEKADGWYSVTLECADAVSGIQIIDAQDPDGNKVQFSEGSEELEKINACTDLENTADIYYGYGILSTNKADIKEQVVTSDVPIDLVTRESPIYGADGKVTFNLSTTEKKAKLKGIFTSWESVDMVPVTDAKDGFQGFTLTTDVPKDGGLYE